MTVSIREFRVAADQPTASDITRLLDIVWQRHPGLKPSENERGTYHDEFARAIEFLCYQRRQREPNGDYAASFFIDLCARSHSLSYARNLKPFIAAAIASGVVYSGRHPYWSIGLALGTTAEPNLAWRETVRLGSLPEPSD